MLILSACGGSPRPQAHPASAWQTVTGAGFHFQAPKGWKVATAAKRTTATSGDRLVQVSTFPLVRPYTAALFAKVASELRARMDDLARQTGGRVSNSRTVTADGSSSHAYDVAVADHVDEYTFVLRGKREYLLLCRRAAKGDRSYCERLVTSFAT